MNILRNIIAMARANPTWARTAIALDASIGLVFGIVASVVLTTTVTVTSKIVLAIAGLFAIVGIVTIGYSLFIDHTRGVRELDFDFPEEGEACQNCGAKWTGTL